MKGLLFVSSGDVIDGSLVAGYVASQGGEASLNGLTLASHASLPGAKLQEGSFLGICSVASVEATHSEALVNLLYRLLQPGGTLSIQQAAQDQSQLSKQLLFQGFADIQPALPLQNGAFALMAKRPEWNVGAKSKLSLRSKPQQQSMPLEAAAASNGQAANGPAGKGCKPARKACANCSCGRADAEARGEKVVLNGEDNAQSACGSCGLGDAFRCETCPYRGQPAFDMSKKSSNKIALATDFLTADA